MQEWLTILYSIKYFENWVSDCITYMMTNLKKAVKKYSRTGYYVHTYRRLRDKPTWKKIHAEMSAYTKDKGSFFFVQIGSNDGIKKDPIREHILKEGWCGILVEPIQYIFQDLKANYKGVKGLSFCNAAISHEDGVGRMIAAKDLPNNPAKGLSSFGGKVLNEFRWRNPDIDDWVEPTEVETLTLSTLLRKYGVSHVDGLFMDTEGHDKIILDQLDLSKLKPNFILYEHYYLSKTEQSEMKKRLTIAGYSIMRLRVDSFARLQPTP